MNEITDKGFLFTGNQGRAGYRVNMVAVNGEPISGFQAITQNGSVIPSTAQNFIPTITPDNVAFSGWGTRGGAGSNPLVTANFGTWIENNLGAVTWTMEIDSNNEGATQTEGNDSGGVGIVVNTGSTYSPDTGIKVRRGTGAGTGPGFLRGIHIYGARNVGLRIEAMSPISDPGLIPAAPASIEAVQVMVGGDAYTRFMINQDGTMNWGSGSSPHDVAISRGAGSINIWGKLNIGGSNQLLIDGTQVVKMRDTGWTPISGTSNKATSYNTSTMTHQQLAERVAALQAVLAYHGLIGQ